MKNYEKKSQEDGWKICITSRGGQRVLGNYFQAWLIEKDKKPNLVKDNHVKERLLICHLILGVHSSTM